MSRYVDADKARNLMREIPLGEMFIDAVMNLTIDRLPTADVVEVVRCKDCKHYSYAQSINRYECNIFNGAYNFIGYPTKPNDYCSYGERREGRNNDQRRDQESNG